MDLLEPAQVREGQKVKGVSRSGAQTCMDVRRWNVCGEEVRRSGVSGGPESGDHDSGHRSQGSGLIKARDHQKVMRREVQSSKVQESMGLKRSGG
jgi:hypothetical protein